MPTVATRIKVTHEPSCRRTRCGGAFRCRHCGRWRGYCLGAADALEDLVGPVCDICAAALPAHVHEAAQSSQRRAQRIRGADVS